MMKQLLGNSYIYGANAPFIEALYEAWLKDPAAAEPRWRAPWAGSPSGTS